MNDECPLVKAKHTKNKDRMLSLYEKAYFDALATGYGFIMIKSNSKTGVTISHANWIDVHKALEDLGVVGSFGGKS